MAHRRRIGVRTGHNRRGNSKGWAKGHSSDSNPATNRHRQAVRGRLGAAPAQAARPVDEQPTVLLPDVGALDLDGVGNAGGSVVSGAESAISQLTACTNPTFVSVHRVWKSGSHNQAEVVAVLAALTEMIQEQGGQQTDAEYFAALVSMISAQQPQQNTTVEQIAATAMLLGVVIRKINYKTLRYVYPRVSQSLQQQLGVCVAQGDTSAPALKHLAICLGHLLRAQSPSIWQHHSNRALLDALCSVACTHANPAVRKATRNALVSIVCHPNGDDSESDVGLLAASSAIADHCVQFITSQGGAGAAKSSTLHTIALLEGVMHRAPDSRFKQAVEALLTLLSVVDVQLKQSALKSVHACLLHRPDARTLSAGTAVQLVNALHDLHPPVHDQHTFPACMLALTEAHACLQQRLDDNDEGDGDALESQLLLLPRTVALQLSTIDAQQSAASVACASQCVQRLLELCGKPLADRATPNNANASALNDVLQQLRDCLTLRNAAYWPTILALLQAFFQHVGRTCARLPALSGVLGALVQLRESDQAVHRRAIDNAVAAAVRHCGAQCVLSHIGLGVQPDAPVLSADVANSWLLPLMRDAVRSDSLLFYCSQLLVAASKLYRRVNELRAQGSSPLVVRVHTVVQQQLWELLPAFCLQPTDLTVDVFKDLSRILGVALLERAELRACVCAALRNLCRYVDAQPEHRPIIAAYAKNFMPILFNIYTTTDDGDGGMQQQEGYEPRVVRAAVLECIREYVGLCEPALIADYFERAQHKAHLPDAPLQRRLLTCDIIIAMLPHLAAAQLAQVKDLLTPWLKAADDKTGSLQKKAYRILQVLCETGNAAAIHDLQQQIRTAGDAVKGPSRSAHSSVIGELIEQCVTVEHLDTLLDDAFYNLLDYLDVNEKSKTRRSAADRLQQIINKSMALTAAGPPIAIEKLVFRLGGYCGAGDTAAGRVRAGLIAGNIIVRTAGKDANTAAVDTLCGLAMAHIHDTSIAARCAGKLLQALLKNGPTFIISHYEPTVLRQVFAKQLPTDQKCRERIRYGKLMRLLVDHYGQPIVAKYIGDASPDQWTALLRAQAKRVRRKKQKKLASSEQSSKHGSRDAHGSSARSLISSIPDTVADLLQDSDDEEDEDDDVSLATRKSGRSVRSNRSQRSASSTTKSMWLNEGRGGAEVLDLLDSQSMAAKLTGTNPTMKTAQTKKADGGFKTGKDGRLIILDQDDDNAGGDDDDTSDEEDELLVAGKRKRKQPGGADIVVEEKRAKAASVPSEYRHGGRGIHRNVQAQTAGAQYKAHNAKGDVKKKTQKHEPYAYIPMSNRRKAAKFGGQVKRLVAGAKKGATKGSKGKKSKHQRQKLVPI